LSSIAARSAGGVKLLVELTETVNAAVDPGGYMDFPTMSLPQPNRAGGQAVGQADVTD
jgi:hypothetical protein